MDAFAARTGRQYHLFDYVGHPEAERVLVLMGSATETAEAAVDWLTSLGQRVGVLKVRLYRPVLGARLRRCAACHDQGDRRARPDQGTGRGRRAALPRTSSRPSTKRRWRARPRSPDAPRVIGGRYGLSSKEFTPAMACAVFDELDKPSPKHHFTIGIVDDVSHSSIDWDRELDLEPADVSRSVFFGLGADGTVGANKNSIKIIGEETDAFAQGYFVYDSKKSGASTISHLRFGPRPIRSPYLIKQAGFVGCHQFSFLDKYDVLAYAAPGAVLLLNSPYGPEQVWDALPREVQDGIVAKGLRALRHRCRGRRAGQRHGHAHQHRDADVLLCPVRCASARPGHRADQARDREDLRQARCGGRAAQLRRGRRHAAAPARRGHARRRPPPRGIGRRPCRRRRPTSSRGCRP